jgi:hypothetical protein
LENDIGVFVNMEQNQIEQDRIYFDLADDFVYANCEELVAGDGCIVGNRYPTKSFEKRIKTLVSLMTTLIGFPMVKNLKFFLSEYYFEIIELSGFKVKICKISKVINFLFNAYKEANGATPDVYIEIIGNDEVVLEK